MTTQLVKKNFGGKRKGYKGKKWYHTLNRSFNPLAPDNQIFGSRLLGGLNASGNSILAAIMSAGFFKEGGRVRGVGKAKRGYGRAMRKQGK